MYLQILQDALQKICASVRGLQEELQKQKAHVGILEALAPRGRPVDVASLAF